MPLSVSETQEPQTADIDSPEAIEDVSLGQVMHVPTVEELSDQRAEEPYIAQSYSEPIEEQPDLDEVISSAEEGESTESSPFRQLNETEQAEEDAYDSEFEEAIEEHKGWNKGIILVALLGILSAASSFYYMSNIYDI
jgi:hypothetical protein